MAIFHQPTPDRFLCRARAAADREVECRAGAGDHPQDVLGREARAEQEAKVRADQEAKARADQEAKARAEQEAKARAEQEAKSRAEQEAKARAEQQRAERLALQQRQEEERRKAAEAERIKAEQEAKARAERDARARAAQEAKARAEQEAKARAEQQRAERLVLAQREEEERRAKAADAERLKAQREAALRAHEKVEPSPEQSCAGEEKRLVRLRANPARDEVVRFARELHCAALRPQVNRLLESLGGGEPAALAPVPAPPAAREQAPQPPPAVPEKRESKTGESDPRQACRRDEERLAQLRANPVRDAVARFARELTCEDLRPQVQRLLESVGG